MIFQFNTIYWENISPVEPTVILSSVYVKKKGKWFDAKVIKNVS